jgi:hypothetical protein
VVPIYIIHVRGGKVSGKSDGERVMDIKERLWKILKRVVKSVAERVMDTKEKLWITLKIIGVRWRAYWGGSGHKRITLKSIGERWRTAGSRTEWQREEERTGLTAMEREVIGVESSDDQWELLVGESRLYIILCISKHARGNEQSWIAG